MNEKLVEGTTKETLRMLSRQIGGLQILLGCLITLPLFVSLLYGEFYSALGFFISLIIILAIGGSLYKGFDKASEPLNRHALIISALGWLSIALMGALPYYIIAHITPLDILESLLPKEADYQSSILFFKNPLHAFFESMSAFTTTGLTMCIHEPSVGNGLLFYRSLSQWVGGAGFVVLSLAILRQSAGRGAHLLYGAESTGERLKPTVFDTARSIWSIYIGLTLFSTLYLILGTYFILPEYPLGNNIFDSINHAMTGQSTGGFSTLDDSIAGYQSRSMEILYILPMMLGALSIPFYFKIIYEKQFNQLWNDVQTRTLIIAFVAGSLILSMFLLNSGLIESPFREGIFQYISALSTTGWQTSNIGEWDANSVVFIVTLAMLIGGSVGATVGGIKIIRILIVVTGLKCHVNRVFLSPNTIQITKFKGERLLPEEMNRELASASTFSFIYLFMVFASTMITIYFMPEGFDLSDALFEAASAQGTIGLSTGITAPSMHPAIEFSYIINMLAGRLEIIPLLVLIRVIIWGTKPTIE